MMICSGILLTFISAGVLTFAAISLMHSKTTRSKDGTASLEEVLSAGPIASPLIIGTQNPISTTPGSLPTTSATNGSPSPVTTPVPRASAVVKEDSRPEMKSPAEVVREKAEQTREEAERKRAQAEGLYQRHLISEATYKKSQAEYQREMARYQDQMKRLTNKDGGDTD
jgi:hypothetical protein